MFFMEIANIFFLNGQLLSKMNLRFLIKYFFSFFLFLIARYIFGLPNRPLEHRKISQSTVANGISIFMTSRRAEKFDILPYHNRNQKLAIHYIWNF